MNPIGRTTFGQSTKRLLELINVNQRRLDTLGAQLTTGRRILSPSMDGMGAASWMNHQAVLRRNETYTNNAVALQQRYDFTDAQLGEAADALTQLKNIALRESNANATSATRAASAAEVNALRSALLEIANSSFAGANLFGGRKLAGPAFAAVGHAVQMLGTGDVNRVQIGHGVSLEHGLDARPVFGIGGNVIAGRTDLDPRGTLALGSPAGTPARATPLASLNGGQGVDTRGPIRIEVQPDAALGNKLVYEIDIKGAESLADVVAAVNNFRDKDGELLFEAELFNAPSQAYPQTHAASALRLKVRAGSPLDAALDPTATIRIADEPGRTTVRDLGLSTATFEHSFETETLDAPFSGPFNFELQVNGQTLPLSVAVGAPNDHDALASALDVSIATELAAAGIVGVNIGVTAVGDRLRFDVQDATGGGYVAFTPVNDAAADLRLDRATSVFGPRLASGPVLLSPDLAVHGRDLDPALHGSTRLSDLLGGRGLSLEQDPLGAPRLPQGVRVTHGDFSAVVNLEPLVNDPNATIDDLRQAFARAGVHVELGIAPDGRSLALTGLLSGTALMVEDFNGTLGTQLGLAAAGHDTRVDDLLLGLGLDRVPGTDLTLTLRDGRAVNVDLGHGSSAASLADAINAAPDNVNPAGAPPTWFNAQVVRQRAFESLPIIDPEAALAFDVSLNGQPPQAVTIPAQAGRTHDDLAAELQDAMNVAARRSGLDGFSARVSADGDELRFTLEDADGVARAAFSGTGATALGLGGQLDANFETRLRAEQVADLLVIRDNTFDPAAWTPGDNTPVLAPANGSGAAHALGLGGSFDPATGRFVSADLGLNGRGDDSVFGVLADLTRALNADAPDAIARQIDRLQSALDAVLDSRAEAGARAQRTQLAVNRLENESFHVTAMAAQTMDVDLAQAAQEFQQTQLVLQAGLAATSRVGQISLFDYI